MLPSFGQERHGQARMEALYHTVRNKTICLDNKNSCLSLEPAVVQGMLLQRRSPSGHTMAPTQRAPRLPTRQRSQQSCGHRVTWRVTGRPRSSASGRGRSHARA